VTSAEGLARGSDEDLCFAVRGLLAVESGLVPGAVVVKGSRIAEVVRGSGGLDLPALIYDTSIVSAGFIDLQVNGGFGVEVSDDARAIVHLSRQLPGSGVTAYLPTLVSSTADVYPRACQAFLSGRDAPGALPLGLHLEGPFLSQRRAGAHRPSAIEGASEEVFEAFLENGVLRIVTLAPEAAGGLDRIRRLRAHGVVVSLGHTDATYEEFVKGVDAGAGMATHLYNAMSGFSHRAPGAVGAALVDDRVTVGLIADGVHCHPVSVRLAVKAKGAERVALVTDAIAGAGMEPGVYQLDGRDILVDETLAKLPDGKLAGSVLSLDQAVRNVVQWSGIGVSEACRMASEVPARLLGLGSKGSLAPGKDADLVLLDDDLHVSSTFRGGRHIYQRES
jgi:N-acetylglucosamine-6-phosphate deacetylase